MNYLNNLILKFFFLLNIFFILLSCQTVKFSSSITLNQDQIKNLKLIDVHGRTSDVYAGRFNDCLSKSYFENQCALLICKNTPETETHLSCDYYIPDSVNKDELSMYKSFTEKKLDEKYESKVNKIKKEL